MNLFLRFWRSTVGCKVVMAITGIFMVLFLVGHLAGNLAMYAGRDATNAYALALKQMPGPLWVARIGLLTLLAIHLSAAFRLWFLNRAARPVPYASNKSIQSTAASRSMMLTGSLVLAYIVYHLLHFTLGAIQSDNHALVTAEGIPDVYSMVVKSFQNPVVALSYVAAMVLLGFHLSHGISSLFQSLGFNNPKCRPFLSRLGPVLGWILAVGFSTIPLAALAGILALPEGVS